MHSLAQPIYEELNAVIVYLEQAVGPNPTPFNQLWNWQQPSLTGADLIQRVTIARDKIAQIDDAAVLTEQQKEMLARIPIQLNWFRGNVLPNLAGSNAMYVVPPLLEMTDRIEVIARQINPLYPEIIPDWDKIDDEMIPKRLLTRLRSVEANLKIAERRTGDLDSKIAHIDNAYESAQRLPTDLADLAEKQDEISAIKDRVTALGSETGETAFRARKALSGIEEISLQAAKRFDELEKVYRATASAGLGNGFAARATELNKTLNQWVAVLITALIIGGVASYIRFSAMEQVLEKNETGWAFWTNIVFSLVSIAGPVWLGWVATKQISQRFKLAEDYNFKASIATAYEGYRAEAHRHGEDLERRLFGNALARLEEAPLRFVETENFGSPWHELMESQAFQTALEKIPELKGTVAQIVTGTSSALANAGTFVRAMASPNKVEKIEAPGPNSDDDAQAR